MAISYTPPGPVAEAFHQSDAFVRGLAGPIGSGKSVTCCMEIVRRAFEQEPNRDGRRKIRAVAIRNTFPELKSTTIETWLDWFPEKLFGKIKWDTPIRHNISLGDGVEIEMWFLAVDRPDDIKKLLSLEATIIWLNEARELPKAVLDMATGRVGRYPSMRDGGPTWTGVIMDTNMMDDDHWWYRLAEESTPNDFAFFKQPSGLSPNAENLQNLKGGRLYYERQVAGKDQAWVDVYVHAQYGKVSSGKPVYPEFNEDIHVSKTPLVANRSLPLLLGWDFGLTPACSVHQLTPFGQLRVLREFTSENSGITRFANDIVKPELNITFPNYKIISYIDPAGAQRSQTDERTCRDVLKAAGFNPSIARTNAFTPRREAVAGFLTQLVDSGQPAFLLDPSCKTLRKGMRGDYKFRRVQVPGEERFTDAPDKTLASHICESSQYVAVQVARPLRQHKPRHIPTAERYAAASIAGY